MRRALAPLLASIAVLAATSGGSADANAEPAFRGTIAYSVRSEKTRWIEALDLATGKVTRLTDKVPAEVDPSLLVWSPNGRELAFVTSTRTHLWHSVKVIDVQTRRVRNLTASLPAGQVGGILGWSPNGRSIAVQLTHGYRRVGIYIVTPGRPGAPRVHYGAFPRMSTWSPAGARFTIVDDSGRHAEGCSKRIRIVTKAIAGGNPTEIRAKPARAGSMYEVSTLSWRPSGGALLYTTNDTARLTPGNARTECYPNDSTGAGAFSVDARGTTKRLFTASSGTIPRAAWSPTGRHIVLQHLRGHVNDRSSVSTLRVLTLGARRERTLVSGFRGEFAWSRGGKLIEASGRNVLLRDVTTGRARVLSRWQELNEPRAHIFAVGTQAVAVHAGNDFVHRLALVRLGGGSSKLITLESQSPEYRIGDIAVTLP